MGRARPFSLRNPRRPGGQLRPAGGGAPSRGGAGCACLHLFWPARRLRFYKHFKAFRCRSFRAREISRPAQSESIFENSASEVLDTRAVSLCFCAFEFLTNRHRCAFRAQSDDLSAATGRLKGQRLCSVAPRGRAWQLSSSAATSDERRFE